MGCCDDGRRGEQLGYDEMASAYDDAFPTGYGSAAEHHAMSIFADDLVTTGLSGPVVDVGCGTGHITHDLWSRGLDVVGVDPSTAMLALAQRRYPGLCWRVGDASLRDLPRGRVRLAGIVARFSLIHVQPHAAPGILATWTSRLQPKAHVLVAFQCSEDPGSPVREFDHAVARAWRWHPDAMVAALAVAGLSERWRLVTQPDDSYRFATCHLVCQLATCGRATTETHTRSSAERTSRRPHTAE